MVAEVVKHLCPRLVEMHNYQPANSVKQKLANWHTLQHKVLRKVDLTVPENVLQGVVAMKPGVVREASVCFHSCAWSLLGTRAHAPPSGWSLLGVQASHQAADHTCTF